VAASLGPVAGVDEAGRGACAGPLVAAAVILPISVAPSAAVWPRDIAAVPIPAPGDISVAPPTAARLREPAIAGRRAVLNDSKLLSPHQRAVLYDEILRRAVAVAVVEIAPTDCDKGIQEANLQALRRAVWRLPIAPCYVITDGFPVAGLGRPGIGMWKADATVDCVAAASIVAKVTRDRIMDGYDGVFPGYGFAVHKGYATAAHQRALEELGPCPIHRLSYANVKRALRPTSSPFACPPGVTPGVTGEPLAEPSDNRLE